VQVLVPKSENRASEAHPTPCTNKVAPFWGYFIGWVIDVAYEGVCQANIRRFGRQELASRCLHRCQVLHIRPRIILHKVVLIENEASSLLK